MSKRIVILGAGTAGTIMANLLSRHVSRKEFDITIIDAHKTHYYQPGFLFVPFGAYTEQDVKKPKTKFLPSQVNFIQEKVEQIDYEHNAVVLESQQRIDYYILIIATGAKISPSEISGLEGPEWHNSIFDFYTLEGALKLYETLKTFKQGKVAVHIAEMPIKCPVAPLEFVFLADAFFHNKGIRRDVELTYVTPLSGAFTKPRTAKVLGHLLASKNINLIPDFQIESLDSARKTLHSYDEKTVDYDLLITTPTNMGDAVIGRSGLGDDLNFVPTDKHTLQAKKKENIFVIGDATDLTASKAGSVAHFEADILLGNLLDFINNKPLSHAFDGHANCFIESGFDKAFLIDFNYDVEPVQGAFPLPFLGPFSLLKESRLNHIGKLAFRYMYWHLIVKGLPIPMVGSHMSKLGKKIN